MYKAIRKPSRQQSTTTSAGRKYQCPDCSRACRTERGLKAHRTTMHSQESHRGELMSTEGHSLERAKAATVDGQLREVRKRISENIERLQAEIIEIDKAIEVCERHLGEGS